MATAVSPSDPLVIMFTSGSSGTPKGVVHSHGSALGAVRSGLAPRCIDADTRLYLPMPFFWVGGFGERSAVGAAGGRDPGHRADPASRRRPCGCSSASGSRCSAAGPIRPRRWPTRIRRRRPVVAAAGQPRGAAAAELAPPRCPGDAVRHDRVVRPVLRIPRRHRHAGIGVGQLREAVRRHGGAHRRRRHGAPVAPATWARSRSADRTPCAASAGAAARTCSPPTGTTPPAISAISTPTGSCSITAGLTTCSRSAVRPCTPARWSGRCAPSTASATPSSPTCPPGTATGWALSWCATDLARRTTCAPRRTVLSAFKVPTVWLLLASDDDVPRGSTGKVAVDRLREMLTATAELEG